MARVLLPVPFMVTRKYFVHLQQRIVIPSAPSSLPEREQIISSLPRQQVSSLLKRKQPTVLTPAVLNNSSSQTRFLKEKRKLERELMEIKERLAKIR